LLTFISFFQLPRRPPTSPLFPYTTLFRSDRSRHARAQRRPDGRDPAPAPRSARSRGRTRRCDRFPPTRRCGRSEETYRIFEFDRSEEHTSELQSLTNLVCRLLLEKTKKNM